MHRKFILPAALFSGLLLAAFGAQAQSGFSTVSNVPATALSAEQMATVEGKAHIYLLVESKGVELPARAEAATRAAAPTPQGGGFTRSPSREATAFNFLN